MSTLALFALLGIVQGLTEFLPVSSSGHLVILQKVLRISADEVTLSVVLHLGTTLALITFFFKDIIKVFSNARLLKLIIIVTVITGIIGVTGKDFFEGLFGLPRWVALFLCVTGIILIFTQKFKDTKRNNLNAKDALILGVAQGIAIIPGISRSGITIATLLFRKIDRETSFRFSFLASIPAVLGATILKARDFAFTGAGELLNLATGFFFSFTVGLFALWMLGLVMRKAKLHYFGYYCILVALVVLLIL
jgi:undecaprenyl-diphosphatase